ncbi:MAG: Gfo/Idh/MocA family oxidoreductase [Clostridia bacterium]|nr:Gfo/Idh/MocA family oxidoreductase [Clostridia bacterium]
MERTVKMGVIGCGPRGRGLIKTICACKEAEIVAVCDIYQDRVDSSIALIEGRRGNTPLGYTDSDQLLANKDVEAVLISAGWEAHLSLATASMKAGKITALEVSGMFSVEDCWELVNVYEQTKTPLMFMENCCYDKYELLATSLARAGRLGEIVHCHGSYSHDLRKEIAESNLTRHYRLQPYIDHNCENYPTHELGPIAKLLDINRGNRMVRLVSMASKSAGLQAYIDEGHVDDPLLEGVKIKQGDVVSTIITCENGETITMTLDTSLPRYYSREFTVKGTKGMLAQEPEIVYIEGDAVSHHYHHHVKNADNYKAYLPSIWTDISDEEKKLGHGGMDYFLFKGFFDAILSGSEMPIDVYDAAAWMCITALSEKSIAEGGMPQEIPDFTRGAWKTRPRLDVLEFPTVVLDENAEKAEKKEDADWM